MAPRRVAVVPHTHWDREWYEPFQTFRMRLVDLVDDLLDLMESDPSYARYLLDGQMAVVDDYLEIRPEHAERLRRLAASGRLELGPWYILMDEFLVSGETLVRDLQLGLRRAAAFGGGSRVGYLPDMFGHVAQMPQLLRLAGIEHAVVWRGVPSAVTTSAFTWRAPDGSEVRTEYLLDGYGNGATLPDDAKAFVTRVRDHVAAFDAYLSGDQVLLMNGSDHQPPQPFLGRLLAEANALQDEFDFRVSSLADYLAGAPRDGLDVWHGELRSGHRANMLMGVASNRVDVKRAAARTEQALERRAEPLSALFVPTEEWPSAFLDLAWREVVRNAAHDSICACSVDEVVDAVLHRFDEARQLADGVAARALRRLGDSLVDGGYVVVNPAARARGGVVEFVLVGDGDDERLQVLGEHAALPGEFTFDATTARTLLSLIQSPRLNDDAWIVDVDVGDGDEGLTLTVHVGPAERPGLALDAIRADVLRRLTARPDARVRVQLDQPRLRRVLGRVGEVAGFGWAPLEAEALDHPARADEDGAVRLTNGLVTVEVDGASGTFSIDGHPGFGRLVDGGDLGDSYNYSPPGGDVLVDAPESVRVEVAERGPVRATVVVTATYAWPDHVDPTMKQRTGRGEVVVTTELALVAGERCVRVRTSFVNPARDHRLRVHLPTVGPASGSVAECAFGTVARGLTAEGRPDEFGLPTFPSRRFVQAGRVTVVHEGLHEYEVVGVLDGAGDELALTLLRATGMLSRLGMALRPLPAGPLTPVEGLQLVGHRVDARYAVALDEEDPWRLCDDVRTPLEVVTAPGGGTRHASGTGLAVHGAEVSSLRVVDGLLELRVFNPRDEEVRVEVPGRRGFEVDLLGAAREPFEGSLALRPRGIATLRLRRDPA
jgi:hypothetical protein